MRGEWFLGFYLLRRYRYRHHQPYRRPQPRPRPAWQQQQRKRELILALRLLRLITWPIRLTMRLLHIKPRSETVEQPDDTLTLVRSGRSKTDLTGWDHPGGAA